uniref:Uncharacterized protein LOC111099919 n=1 Tax=Crassostrea virginica TaxID=6565 RepID=A0A8B8A6P4_CRAVI|nr:uncharacterized protein LOC111099919 [Crassostrea virginica]XP_022287138.1 uncharacterized protein LOC111099919 [Crassostrea virginica]
MTSHIDLSDVGDGPPILVVSHNEQESNDNNIERYIKEMMWSQPVQNMVKRRYLPKYIQEALTRMYDLYKNSWEEITETLIMEELDRMKMEKDMSDDDLKIPNADNLKNISASKDLEELQREIAMMCNMMLCKGCGAPATCINIGCGHLMCFACCKMHICKLCASQITEVADVKFSHQE